jgi:hypothetical protein
LELRTEIRISRGLPFSIFFLFWWCVPSSRRSGGAGEGPRPGARGGTEDDDEGSGLSHFLFFKAAGDSLSVPTSNFYKQQLLQIPNFTSLKFHAQLQNLHRQTNSIQTNNSSSQLCTSVYLHPLLLSVLLSVVVVVVVLELLQQLLLFLQETELSSLNIVRQSFTHLSARLYIITEFRISQKAVDSFVFGKSQSSARVSSIFLPFLQVSE